ncbi:oxidoreductase [Actinoplanes sp. SE50]|uniref:SDR family oxidoreductase n=1 Tax=unclassified Actinoplanes TaxID=2626549 RepID=UPI00023EBF47|nr:MULTISPECIES: SDR family oxidoreductase [unclassified Actinoplanes]AEV85158.1 short-chain dehydrogenase/reductase SDR [Actinoplanes sp. SE50/110]ATO83551.1 oxidoreductase [Actinoplanes sp. SE50]SLM00958.1 oxidoreductase [Actinoplanes sp. SE50/110]
MTATAQKHEPATALLPESVAGKNILITGGSTGIGRATAELLASAGARVAIVGRHQPELDDATHDIHAAGGDVLALRADLTADRDVQRVFAELDRHFGDVHIVINNAALGAGSIAEGTYEQWEYVVRTNLLAYLAVTHEAVTRMREQGSGHIVCIGSMSADVREKGSSVYVATKSGIQGFTEALRKEVNEFGIKVSLIEPGAVGTDMQAQFSPQQQREQIEAMTMLDARDIAACVLYTLTQPRRCDVVDIKIRPHRQEI